MKVYIIAFTLNVLYWFQEKDIIMFSRVNYGNENITMWCWSEKALCEKCLPGDQCAGDRIHHVYKEKETKSRASHAKNWII